MTRIFAAIAAIDVTREGLVLREIAPGFNVVDVQVATELRLVVAREIAQIATQERA